MPMGALEYHLDQLERAGLVSVVHAENKRFFPANVDAHDKRALALLRQESARRIVMKLMERPATTRGQLATDVELPPSTVTFYLSKLVASGLVERRSMGRENHYSLRDPSRVHALLVRYRSSFLDRVLDGFLDGFDALRMRKEP